MSRAWALQNLDGSDSFVRGQLDLVWLDGAPAELTDPYAVLAQQVKKATIEPKRNPFDRRWGSGFDQEIGAKLLTEGGLRDIGEGVRAMVDSLIVIQGEQDARLGLDPAELIVNVASVKLSTDGTSVRVAVALTTRAGAAGVVLSI